MKPKIGQRIHYENNEYIITDVDDWSSEGPLTAANHGTIHTELIIKRNPAHTWINEGEEENFSLFEYWKIPSLRIEEEVTHLWLFNVPLVACGLPTDDKSVYFSDFPEEISCSACKTTEIYRTRLAGDYLQGLLNASYMETLEKA